MGGRFFEILGVGADVVGVLEIDRSKLGPDDDETGEAGQAKSSAAAPPPAAKADKTTTFRVLIVYSSEAARRAGNNVRTIATTAVMHLNTALRQSQTNAQANLSGPFVVASLPDDLTTDPLKTLMTITAVKQRRVENQADIVTAIVTKLPGNFRGKGNIFRGTAKAFAPDAYSVVSYAAITTYTYAHEIGHNLGCGHDDQGGRFVDSHGYQIDTERTGQKRTGFRTVMARGNNCPNGCDRILYFSDPNVREAKTNRPTGNVERNNAETIRLTISDVARFHTFISAAPPP
jgi:hypothetical protein